MSVSPDGSAILDEFGATAEQKTLIARSAQEFELTGQWVSYDALAYEAAERGELFDRAPIWSIPQWLGYAWSGENLGLTALAVLASGAAPKTSGLMAKLARIAGERKYEQRENAFLGSEILVADYGFSKEEASRCRSLIAMIPGLAGSGNDDGTWTRQIDIGALRYRTVDTPDDLLGLLAAQQRVDRDRYKQRLVGAIAVTDASDAANGPLMDRTPFEMQLGERNVRRLAAVLSSGMSADSLAVSARWWQLESYLRLLVYVYLCSVHGRDWQSHLGDPRAQRRAEDAWSVGYMRSADDSDPLAHLDVGVLFALIKTHWDDLKHGVGLSPSVWEGRVEELKPIRHRQAHCRRPHVDDADRIEQTLRDLEPAANKVLRGYTDWRDVDPTLSDPVVAGWAHRRHPVAARLVEHGARKGIHFDLMFSSLPWSLQEADSVTGSPGYFWVAHVVMDRRQIYIDDYVEEPAVEHSSLALLT